MASRIFRRPKFHAQFDSFHKLAQRLPNPLMKQIATNSEKSPPQMPQKSRDRNLISLAGVLRRYGFSPSGLNNFLKKNQFLLNIDPSDVEKSLKILLSVKPSQEFLASVVYSCPSVLELDFLRKWETGFSEMELSSVTSIAIQNILEVSRRFELGPDDVSKCTMCLKGLGLSERTIVKVLEAFPMVLMVNEDEICDKITFLMDIGMEKIDIDRIFHSFPFLLAFEVSSRMKPLLDDFENLGFSLDVVRREVLRDPQVLGLEVGELSQCLKMVRSLKCRVAIKDSIFCNGDFRAGYEVKLRVDFLRKYGLTYRDAFSVLWKEPRAILYEIMDIEKKIEFLVHTMKFDVLCLVEVPQYLGVNFEKKIVPRFNVIDYLRSRGWLGDEVGLRALIKPSRLRFYNLYVKPYPVCEKMYGRYAGDAKMKSGHPVGMWNLFRPPKHLESKQDVRNIKSFLDSMA